MSDTPSSPPPATPSTEEGQQEELSEFEQQFLDVVSSRFQVSEGTEEPGSAETLGQVEGQSAAAGDEGPVEGQEPESPATAPTEPVSGDVQGAPVEGEAPGGESGQSQPVFTFSGVDYTADQLSQAIQVHDWFAHLDPRQVQAIDALMSGQYRLTPAQEQQAQQQPVVSSQPSPSPSPTVDEGEWLDPRAAQEISALRSQLNELQQSFQQSLSPVIERQQSADYNARLQAISSASDEFQQKYSMSDENMRAMEQAIVEAQVLPSLSNRYGSVSNGMAAALEMFFWTTPQFRDEYVKAQAASQAASSTVDEAATVRKQQLTALSASGGSAPRREPVPSTPEDRHAAMAAEIAAAMNGSGTIQ